MRETSCSPEHPPKIMPTLSFGIIASPSHSAEVKGNVVLSINYQANQFFLAEGKTLPLEQGEQVPVPEACRPLPINGEVYKARVRNFFEKALSLAPIAVRFPDHAHLIWCKEFWGGPHFSSLPPFTLS
jgi:hypothetical protein